MLVRLVRSAPKFQSAPLTEARGDTRFMGGRKGSPRAFQSAPLTEARGDAGRLAAEDRTVEFQSAPLTEARGDGPLPDEPAAQTGFNPLPSPKQGETYHD